MSFLKKLSIKLFTLSLLAAAFGFTTLRAQTVAYVANNLDGTVEAINTSTDAVIATISGFSHPSDLALSPNGALLYVYTASSEISVVNTATNTITANISFPLGAASEGAGNAIAFSPNGQFAYVANSIGNLTVINTQSSTVAQTVSLPSGFGPVAVAASSDGNSIYVASGQGDGILVLTANTFATVTTIASGHLVLDLALSPDGSTLYGSDSSGLIGGTNGVLVVNTATNAVVTTVPLPFSSSSPSFVFGLAVTPDGLNVYAENDFFTAGNSTVSVISTASDSVTTTIPANGLNLTNLAITPDDSTVLALNGFQLSSSVAVIPTASNTITNSITVGRFADGLSVGNLCNGVSGGSFNGNVTVSAGQNFCIANAVVTGNVTQNGGNLTVTNSQISGNIQINGGGTFTINPGTSIGGDLQVQNLPAGSAQNQICGTSVHGNLQFHNNGTAVLIGSDPPQSSCPGNTVGNDLQVQNNTAATSIVGNTVGGNLTDQGNTAPTQVFNNMVGNNLQCQNNTSITGGGNTAKSKQGQCASF